MHLLTDTPFRIKAVPGCRSDEAHKKNRERLKFPVSLSFKTGPQSAAEMSEGIVREAIIPFRYVVADSVYGESDDFTNQIESHTGITCFVGISCDTFCRLKNPVSETGSYRCRKEVRTEKVVAEDEKNPVRVDNPAGRIHNVFRYRRTVSEGAEGPTEYEFTEREITPCRSGLPTKNVRLIMKRTPGKKNYRFYISNALPGVRLPTFVWLSGIRRAIEQCFQEAKSESGTDHYEVRKFTGWNHHILTCMPAHFFLWHLRIRSEKKAPSITLSQPRILLRVILPVRSYDTEEIILFVREIQIGNHRAYLSHRKKKLRADYG